MSEVCSRLRSENGALGQSERWYELQKVTSETAFHRYTDLFNCSYHELNVDIDLCLSAVSTRNSRAL